MPGLQHKYRSTALLLVSNSCAGLCRYCFRKRIFITDHSEVLTELPAALDYLREDRRITNVLITGGDPLMLATSELEYIIRKVREIDHIRIVRIGTKMAAYNPYRIADDPSLLGMIERCTTDEKKIYIMTHFNHPRELTDIAMTAVSLLQKSGAILANQTPLVAGVNDNPETLAGLFRELACVGVAPYYLFQCRPAIGNRTYAVPLEKGHSVFERAKSLVSGLGKRARYVMSHESGKIEMVGKMDQFMYFKYHRAARDEDSNRFMVFRSNPHAYWFDDYQEMGRRSSEAIAVETNGSCDTLMSIQSGLSKGNPYFIEESHPAEPFPPEKGSAGYNLSE
jgi:KamA family protein